MPQQQVRAVRRNDRPSTAEMEALADNDTPAAADHVTVEQIDELLNEIDDVLEHNAIEVLARYVQRGGQ